MKFLSITYLLPFFMDILDKQLPTPQCQQGHLLERLAPITTYEL